MNDDWNRSPTSPKLFVMVGIPGSGKSTWAASMESGPYRVVSLDRIRKDTYGYFPSELDEALEERVWSEAFILASDLLKSGENVILDSMALTKAFRKHILDELESHLGNNFEKVAVFLETPLEVSLKRNRSRDKFVREETVIKLAKALEPPQEDEHFSRIIRVAWRNS